MPKHIHQHKITPHTKEWHAFRWENGIGGSEIAPVAATVSSKLSELVYTPPIKWFLGKIGEPVQEFTGNVESESGHYFESIITHWYKYYDMEDPDQMAMFKRIKENKRVNKIMSPKSFFTNDKYPGFFYSPDVFCWRGMKKKVLGECKNTTSMTARRYVNKVDPAFFLQVQQGLMILEMEEADLLILVDGRWFEPITIKADPEIHKTILEVGSDMWLRVLKARQIKLEYGIANYYGINPDFLSERQREGVDLLSQLEPDLLGTTRELEFVKEMIVPSEEDVEMQGTPEQLKLAIDYHKANDIVKGGKKEVEKIYAELILSLGTGYNKAVFDDGSYFSYKKDARGATRLYVSDKVLKSNEL